MPATNRPRQIGACSPSREGRILRSRVARLYYTLTRARHSFLPDVCACISLYIHTGARVFSTRLYSKGEGFIYTCIRVGCIHASVCFWWGGERATFALWMEIDDGKGWFLAPRCGADSMSRRLSKRHTRVCPRGKAPRASCLGVIAWRLDRLFS